MEAAEAARLLTQASYGPSPDSIEQATGMTPHAWIDQQLALAPTLHLAQIQNEGEQADRAARLSVWWDRSLHAPDQLRQRVAFALSEIMVVSDVGALAAEQYALAWYYDVLLRNAFGNFRTLLEEVTLAPAMGRYLSMLGNRKPDEAAGIRTDENFAREVMQLFTIGLVQLNADGTEKRDGLGRPLPTYSQDDIENLALALTGWSWAGATNYQNGPANWLAPMEPFGTGQYHDTSAKTLVGGVQVPAGGTARQDLAVALDALANHPNVGPFIGRQLIQRLVTSNPTAAYVQRVARVFNDNGRGVRGDLGAVVRAILLDSEARIGPVQMADFGKAREPVLVVTHLWRALDARAGNGRYLYSRPERDLGQGPLSSPSVFNFFRPHHSPPGVLAHNGLQAPEFELANESSVITFDNSLNSLVRSWYVGRASPTETMVLIDIENEKALAADPAALVNHLDLLFMGGQMSQAMRDTIVAHLESVALGNGQARALDAIYLTLTSSQYLVQR